MNCARKLIALVAFSAMSLVALRSFGADAVLKPEDLLAKHLDAIGSPDARAGKNRVVQGDALYRIVVGGGGRTDGTTGLVSEGRKLRFMMKFPQGGDYKGENFVYDGNKLGMAFSTANQSRSPLSYFIAAQDVIIKDGLLGGVLSTAWPLLNLADRKAKLSVDGLKKVDGRQLYQVTYQPAKHADITIQLYFEPETFRHVKTVYSLALGNNVGADVTLSAKLQQERTTLEERFSDFKTVDGLVLPSHWNLQFTRELPNGSTSVNEWDLTENQVKNNIGLDPKNFEVK